MDYPLELDVYICVWMMFAKTGSSSTGILLPFALLKELGPVSYGSPDCSFSAGLFCSLLSTLELGLKTNEKTSCSMDKDVKMTDAEGSSNGHLNLRVMPDKEMHVTRIYDLVALLTHKGIMLLRSIKKVGNGSRSMMMIILSHNGWKA
ncbi:Ubiquitin carboxyl-terminal hydrolase [Actinidia chinensis var. chinensis]|uniref:Ubiquitin carboxyl-terminal hydrolase n=1 Tax=Actinidia chinensis var. chinensis TaxID=1590841 RepID=A0A2R6QFH0_ACTCC|nr:Ubiquitin carboxyl-terminal hydrolase [Actinidia chinensis var. chinensis]